MKTTLGSDGFRLRNDKIIDEMEMTVEAEGFTPGTPQFDAAMRGKKVEKCQEVKGFLTCSQCPAVMECSLRLALLRDGVAVSPK